MLVRVARGEFLASYPGCCSPSPNELHGMIVVVLVLASLAALGHLMIEVS